MSGFNVGPHILHTLPQPGRDKLITFP